MRNAILYSLFILLLLPACKKDVTIYSKAHFIFQFDPDQERLDNLGDPSVIPAGHGTQIPDMLRMSAHYIELVPDALTPYKDGSIVFKGPETDEGGDNAIDFAASSFAADGDEFFSVPTGKIPPGTYHYIRVSIAYQECNIHFDLNNIPGYGDLPDQNGTTASFLGYNTFIKDLSVNNLSIPIYTNKLQGFWGFATAFTGALEPYNALYTGQAPAGATTVVNPLHDTAPVPNGSCVITGAFADPLVVSGDETDELYIYLSFSINQSFEWVDTDGDGKWDIDATNPEETESITDMGIRGLVPSWEWK
ncbi:MAG: hypothetical protein R2794_04160 [Chitinophagales bacterium]